MKLLVVGLGSSGRRHARNWVALGLGEVVLCRLANAPQPEPLGVEARGYDNLPAALEERPDLVVVSNPTHLHVLTALEAVRAGCHVLVEKPLGASLEGVPDLLAAARAEGVHVRVGYMLRFHPLLARMRDLLRAGMIGRPLSARAEVGEYLPDWHPWEDYRQGYSARAAMGGGPILTLSHDLDALLWLLGPPTHVTCLAAHASGLDLDTEDTAEIGLRLASGAVGSVHVDYLRRAPRRTLEVVGEDGVLRWEADGNRLHVFTTRAGQWRTEEGSPAFTRNDLFLAELRAATDLVAGEGDGGTLATAEEGAAVLAVALAAHAADRQNRAVDLRPGAADPFLARPEAAAVPAWLAHLGAR